MREHRIDELKLKGGNQNVTSKDGEYQGAPAAGKRFRGRLRI